MIGQYVSASVDESCLNLGQDPNPQVEFRDYFHTGLSPPFVPGKHMIEIQYYCLLQLGTTQTSELTGAVLQCWIGCPDFVRVIALRTNVLGTGKRNDILAVQ